MARSTDPLNVWAADGRAVMLDLGDTALGENIKSPVRAGGSQGDTAKSEDMLHVPCRELLGIPPVGYSDLTVMARRSERFV